MCRKRGRSGSSKIVISSLPAWWQRIRRVRRLESTQRSYRARKPCLETAVWLARVPSLTMLAQECAGVVIGRLPGRVSFPASLSSQPGTPVAGEAGGGQGETSCSTPRVATSTPGEGEAWRGEEKCAGGGVDDHLACWVSPGASPAPAWWGVPQAYATRGEVRTPWWLAANWRLG